jgi:hypothetical protein
MTSISLMTDGTPTTYGAGLFIDDLQGHRHFEHGGDTLVFHAQAAYLPNDELTIVILTNTEAPFDLSGLERSIVREVLGLVSPNQPAQTLPPDLAAKVSGSYNIPGRPVFGPNPVLLKAADGQASVSVSGRDIGLIYLGAGKFGLDVGVHNVFFQFPMTAGSSEPFFSLYIDEMLFARGMRTNPSSEIRKWQGTTSVMPSALKWTHIKVITL